ncbi:hepatitis A virus cellular receptor 1 homolog isoform X2 [Eleutherodactylus coqui]|uniref:hepatitis A virus cellular receptor 1 homolog isoform X2 n=1 Tax=Eleutherodactylus coqui TaxID=57060 RepID=UPI003461960D
MKLYIRWKGSLQIVILLLSAVTVLCQRTVTGIEGQPITLPCSYTVRRPSDLTSMCWGRGSCPSSKCSQELIWTDGHKVTVQSSSRYQLNDAITEGIVSLTITSASLEDAGTYCCRIEHRGWFNDEKININLMVEKAPTTTTVRTTLTTTTPVPTTMRTTHAPTTVKTSTTPQPVQTTLEPFYVWTTPLTTTVEVTTQPPISITNNTSPPPVIWTETSPSSIARSTTSSQNIFPAENADLTTQSADIPGSFPDDEIITSTESKADDEEHTTHSLWNASLSPNNNGIADLFQGNDTTPLIKARKEEVTFLAWTHILNLSPMLRNQ